MGCSGSMPHAPRITRLGVFLVPEMDACIVWGSSPEGLSHEEVHVLEQGARLLQVDSIAGQIKAGRQDDVQSDARHGILHVRCVPSLP